jgi:hypothetical protein
MTVAQGRYIVLNSTYLSIISFGVSACLCSNNPGTIWYTILMGLFAISCIAGFVLLILIDNYANKP